jgi:hypothetical protein
MTAPPFLRFFGLPRPPMLGVMNDRGGIHMAGVKFPASRGMTSDSKR